MEMNKIYFIFLKKFKTRSKRKGSNLCSMINIAQTICLSLSNRDKLTLKITLRSLKKKLCCIYCEIGDRNAAKLRRKSMTILKPVCNTRIFNELLLGKLIVT